MATTDEPPVPPVPPEPPEEPGSDADAEATPTPAPPPNPQAVDPALDQLLTYIRDARGFDFTGYKRPSLVRRITKRLQAVHLDGDYRAYQELLEVQPDEFTELFDTILINVTGFLRDRQAWDYLAAEILPRILDDKGPEGAIRVWSAGCASGEEVYSLAVLLCEAIG